MSAILKSKQEEIGANNQSSIVSSNFESSKVLSTSQMKRFKTLMVKNTQVLIRSTKAKNEARMEKARQETNRRIFEHLNERLQKQVITEAYLNTVLGDEYLVRLELDLKLHNINERCEVTGRTLLCEAVSRGHFPIVSMLLRDFNADPTITTLLGASSPLHLAVSGGYRQIAAILLTYGADVNATDKNGVTPLQLVNNISVLKLLLKHNANILQKNKQGLTALDYYLRYTNPDKGELSDVGLELKAKEIEVKEALKALKSELLQLKNSTWSS